MIIPSIGKQKIQYKDHSQVNFESLDFYINLAQKTIAKFGGSISKEMLKNEDAISFVANAIMMGDWRWEKEEDRENSHKTLYSYRNQCAIWAIKTYTTKRYSKNKKPNPLSMSHSVEDAVVSDIIKDPKQASPLDILICKENKDLFNSLMNQLFESQVISDKQKEQLQMYYMDNFTLEKIGKKFGVTREAVRQNLKSAINKIRTFI